MNNTNFGTLSWAKETNGLLNEAEKIQLAKNLSLVQAERTFDRLRKSLGVLNPARLDIDELLPPDSKLVKDADDFGRGIYDEQL